MDMGEGAFRKVSVHLPGGDFNRDLKVSIDRVEVRRIVISVVHRDDDSEEAAELGHAAV